MLSFVSTTDHLFPQQKQKTTV